jgi:hypothetical protein
VPGAKTFHKLTEPTAVWSPSPRPERPIAGRSAACRGWRRGRRRAGCPASTT